MSEEKKDELLDNLTVKLEKGIKSMATLKSFAIGLFILFVLGCAILTYMQFATFEQFQKGESAMEYIEKDKENWVYEDHGLDILISENVIAHELSILIAKDVKDTAYNLEHLYYDGKKQALKLNLTFAGFYLPIVYYMEYSEDEGNLRVSYDKVGIGRHEFKVIGPLKYLINRGRVSRLIHEMRIDLTQYGKPSGLDLMYVVPMDQDLKLNFVVNEEEIQVVIEQMRGAINKELLPIYRASSSPLAAEAVDLLEQIYPLSADQMKRMIKDVTGGRELVRHLLVLTNETMTNQIVLELQKQGFDLDREQIALDRKALEGQIIDEYAVEIFNGLEAYFSDQIVAYNNGRPFDLLNMKTVTIQDIVRNYNIKIEDSILERMNFVLVDGFSIAYEVDPSTYYIKSLDGFEVLSKEDYEQLPGSGPYIEPKLVTDLEMWQEVETILMEKFEVERIFIRYMKTDGRSIFTIASPVNNPQIYLSVAMIKDDTIKILEDNVQSIEALLEAHPDFNIETVTREIETVQLKKISEEIQAYILEDMYQQGKLNHPSNYTIEYSSFDGKYISFLVSNGEEYVYRVEDTSFGTYLATVYDKEKAIRNWRDIPKIILLQDKP
ncbi:hypothetical protein [Petrocella sp. FN5]|uniref:hypothetical protein n=1 Tax=Petrocella sp. FN5 TaxID=3032002 RepID=UPI0023DBF0F5|nr:hypothetical protein [Petrocella sp. FN5]MDF1616863.1 hypothetical protein [Petrocella sp. FN5]